jgi:hypothetical protein
LGVVKSGFVHGDHLANRSLINQHTNTRYCVKNNENNEARSYVQLLGRYLKAVSIKGNYRTSAVGAGFA